MTFLRRIHHRYSRLGKRRKKKQIWRRPTGRDNKMRERRRGHPARVEVGYKKSKKDVIKIIYNLSELNKIKKDQIVVVGKVGKKKKMEIVKKSQELKIKLKNINPKSFLTKNKDKNKNESK